MIDGALPGMIDEMLPRSAQNVPNGGCAGAQITPFESASCVPPPLLFSIKPPCSTAPNGWCKAARAAGADAADAVALRSLSLGIEVRDGAVEESESAESDDFGLRVLVGKRQAVVSSNDVAGDIARFRAARGGHGAGRAGGQVRRPRR